MMKLLLRFTFISGFLLALFTDGAAQHNLTLELVFDQYRSETSWELTDTDDNVVSSGGDYGADFGSSGANPHPPIAIEDLPDGEYTFTIFDEYGDGMCCQYGDGSYTLINDSDEAIIVSGGAFGDSESTSFSLPYVAPPAGCTDPEAVNFNPEADVDDGSCEYLTTPLSINLEPWATGLSSPLAMKHAGDERLFVCEQNSGLVRVLDEDGNILGNFINVSSSINSSGSEQGLLGIAFHPNYSENGYFYLNYTNTSGNTEVKRFTVSDEDPNIADPNSGHLIIRINQPFGNHNAGGLEFGPDGYLYLPMGDGGSAGDPDNYAQTTTSYLGKILRLDVDGDDFPEDDDRNYAIPPDNPFLDDSNILDEIWALGMRNPWKFSFDRETNDLWIADVGQNAFEEINLQPANSEGGENYGWRCYEGFNEYNTTGCEPAEFYTDPILEFNQSEYGWCSISGGYVYRGEQYPLLQGYYLVTDYCGPTFYAVRQNALGDWGAELVNDQFSGFNGVVGFGEDIDGELYAIRISNGTIYRVEEPCSASIPVITEDGPLLTSSAGETYQWLLDGNLIEGATEQTYLADETGAYSVVVDDGNGCVVESDEVDVVVSSVEEGSLISELTISPNPSAGQVIVRADLLKEGDMDIQVFDGAGRLVHSESVGQVSGDVLQSFDLSNLSEGIYLMKVNIDTESTSQRIVILK